MRMGTSMARAAVRKCPEPQQGSRIFSSPKLSGQASKAPPAGRHCPSSARTKRRKASGTPGSAALRRNSASDAAPARSSALKTRAAHHAPKVLSSKKLTM